MTLNLNSKYYIFFDVGQVLLRNSQARAVKEIGINNMFWYSFKHRRAPKYIEIRQKLFNYMDYCTGLPRSTAMVDDQQLPGLMANWAKGLISSQEMMNQIINHPAKESFFNSKAEKNLVLGTVNLFKAQVIVKIQKPITSTVQLFQECVNQIPHQVCILSNWDRESARLIERRFPEIFSKIPKGQIFFSGDLGYLKPEPAIYQAAASHLQIDPQNCILIDDHIENIRAARNCGWQAIQYLNTRQVRQELGKIYAKNNLRAR